MGDEFHMDSANITGSVFGGTQHTINNSIGAPSDALLKALVDRRADLLGDAPDDGRDDVRARLDEILAELRSGKPDKQIVRTGWQRIAGIVGVLSDPVMEITKLIAKFLT